MGPRKNAKGTAQGAAGAVAAPDKSAAVPAAGPEPPCVVEPGTMSLMGWCIAAATMWAICTIHERCTSPHGWE